MCLVGLDDRLGAIVLDRQGTILKFTGGAGGRASSQALEVGVQEEDGEPEKQTQSNSDSAAAAVAQS